MSHERTPLLIGRKKLNINRLNIKNQKEVQVKRPPFVVRKIDEPITLRKIRPRKETIIEQAFNEPDPYEPDPNEQDPLESKLEACQHQIQLLEQLQQLHKEIQKEIAKEKEQQQMLLLQCQQDQQKESKEKPPALTPAFTPALNCQQNEILAKIDTYLSLQKRTKRLGDEGYCYGMTLLWLYKMSERNEEWFYSLLEKIAGCPDEKLLELEMDIEKFLAHIEWCQNQHLYCHASNKRTDQCDMANILELRKTYQKNVFFSEIELTHFLKNRLPLNHILVLRAETRYPHAIGIIKRDKNYFLYDPNFSWGRAVVAERAEELIPYIKIALYSNFKIPVPQRFLLGLDYAVINDQNIKNPSSQAYSRYAMFRPTIKNILDDNKNLLSAHNYRKLTT